MSDVKKEMNDIQKEINDAYRMISAVPVSGDAVDVIAGARIHLKEAYKLAGDQSVVWDTYKMLEKEDQHG